MKAEEPFDELIASGERLRWGVFKPCHEVPPECEEDGVGFNCQEGAVEVRGNAIGCDGCDGEGRAVEVAYIVLSNREARRIWSPVLLLLGGFPTTALLFAFLERYLDLEECYSVCCAAFLVAEDFHVSDGFDLAAEDGRSAHGAGVFDQFGEGGRGGEEPF